ncbi:hypothetical protein TGAM01_v208326 [Trichoderma gamsii]|uniref:IPT/TIG domain-containing protein n=1 Tax=Trichoderma gamsii TaxID=398673 RepID=A0A2P4ZEX1_9HYPO|nr:hypothetical protein TGAM01_v208326 [Trichoderma gamsii]PON22846.1 hypothetical protein TGAM01_v208326 [Trichoderma gamsii]
MTPSAQSGASSPLIAGASPMQSDGLQNLSDDELATSNLLHYFPAPDDLQSLTSLGPGQQKAFLNPQELIANVGFPDSPNGSLPDSSSDSTASIQRTGSATSTQTPVMTGMTTTDELDDGMDWRNRHMPGSNDNDSALPFVRQDESLNLMFPSIDNDGEDALMNQFNFPSAFPRSFDTMPSSHMNISSPSIPSTETNSSANVDLPNGHQQNNSYSAASAGGQAREASRELSPMSSMVASHGGSPAGAVFNIPSPSGPRWTALLNSPPSISDTLSSNPNFQMPFIQPPVSRFNNDNTPFNENVNNIGFFDGFRGHDTTTSITKPATYNFTRGYELKIYPTPTKSRVETQIPIKMALNPLPPGITKLHLPPHTISKPKLMAKPAAQRSPDTLELFVSLVCTSAMEQKEARERALERAATNPQDYLPDLDDDENSPQRGGEVRICAGCITRERKRAARKKVKKPEEDRLWSADEHRRVVVFNTSEIKDWQPISALDNNGRPEQSRHARAMQVDAPMRIACYCRHHNEKAGFNVIFTIKDWKDKVIAQAMSKPIMITDDHKTNSTTQPAMSEPVSSSALQQSMDVDNNLAMQTQSGSPMAFSPNGQAASYGPPSSNAAVGVPGRPLSRPPSPNQGGPAKKRKSSASGRVPNGLAMTRMDVAQNMPAQNHISQHVSAATSPFSPNPHSFPTPEAIFGTMVNPQAPFTNGSTTPNGNEQVPLFGSRRSESMDNVSMAQLYSAPTSGHPSRAPSPSGLRNSVNSAALFPQPIGRSLYAMPPASVNEQLAIPIIHKVIPNEGPKVGGIEVTVIGASFVQGHEVWFGGAKAITTTFWGPQALVCLVPPSAVAGSVPVTIGRQEALAYTQPQMFKYIDDTEDKLIRTALAVLGHKMSGRVVDVNELAHRILNNGGPGWGNGPSSGGSTNSGSGSGSGPGSVYHQAAPNETHLESQLLKVLDLIDLDESPHRAQLDLKGSSGHTMLHLACSQGYHRLVAALLARGASPYVRDRGGFTPLHFAALYNHPEIARRLLLARADPTMRSLSSLTAIDVAQSRAVIRTIRSTQRHNRSRSGGSLRSTSSSAASLRSLWEPLTRAQTHEEPISVDPSEESPEYTTDDFEDEDSDDNDILQMRRPSGIALDQGVVLEEVAGAVVDDANNSVAAQTTALAAALKNQVQEQLQQFQQQLSQQLQNFTHLPQIPQMPQMPQMPTFAGMQALPDYQAYLQQAPFIRRVQQLMPNMTGNRPDNQGDNEPKVDGRWWDLSSYMNGASAAPPAYADIYPEADRDRKIQSAARAALEAEADLKYSKLYDHQQQQSSVTVAKQSLTTTGASVATSAGRSTEIPEILEIGRKHAITKEQQENFLRAREQKLKKISNDRNLFFIWIPLLLAMICALLYNWFPGLFVLIWDTIRAIVVAGRTFASRTIRDRSAHEIHAGLT